MIGECSSSVQQRLKQPATASAVATSAKWCGGKDGTNERQTLISTRLGRLEKRGGIVVAGLFSPPFAVVRSRNSGAGDLANADATTNTNRANTAPAIRIMIWLGKRGWLRQVLRDGNFGLTTGHFVSLIFISFVVPAKL